MFTARQSVGLERPPQAVRGTHRVGSHIHGSSSPRCDTQSIGQPCISGLGNCPGLVKYSGPRESSAFLACRRFYFSSKCRRGACYFFRTIEAASTLACLFHPWKLEKSPAFHASRSPGVLKSQSGRISLVTARRSCQRSTTDGRPQNQ
jgi:hypothetical protein